MSNQLFDVPLSVLDLAVITEGSGPPEAFANSLKLARAVEKLGYHRFWLAEHHNMASIASAATSVLIGHIAGGTSKMRVGSGGIMLPNHAPLIIAEQFGTLASLYPERIDLGLGRAPGSDQATARALRRDDEAAHQFPKAISELQGYFNNENKRAPVRAIPGEGLDIPIWILGSSTQSAYLAAAYGLPYAFASHFAPRQLYEALRIYRENFEPSEQLSEPYSMACVNVIASETDERAAVMATSLQKIFMGIVTNNRKPLQPADPSFVLPAHIAHALDGFLSCSFIGAPDRIKEEVSEFVKATGINELMVTSHIYDMDERINSYKILADAKITP